MNEVTSGFFGRRREFVSPHASDEIYRRFTKTVGWPFFSDRSVVGYFDRGGFQLRVKRWYGNSFQTILYGTIKSVGAQARIVCKARMRSFVIAFMALWFLGVIALGGGISLLSISRIVAGAPLHGNLPAVLMTGLLLMFGVALVYFGRALARDEEATLIDFLHKTIDAEEV